MSQIINKGVFCISPVVGLNYQTLTQSGTTNENGEFLYITGETVTFSIGDLVLGSAPGAPEITPPIFPLGRRKYQAYHQPQGHKYCQAPFKPEPFG
jgi:hypothetical protein